MTSAVTPEGAPDPQAFIDSYGHEARVVTRTGTPMTLGQALQFEAAFCTADTVVRQDPYKRIGHLASILFEAGELRPEDEQFLPVSE